MRKVSEYETHFKCSFYDRDEIFRNKRKEKLLFSWFCVEGAKEKQMNGETHK